MRCFIEEMKLHPHLIRTNNCTCRATLIQAGLPRSGHLPSFLGAIVLSKLLLERGIGEEITDEDGIIALSDQS